MKNVRHISNVLFYITSILAFLYLITSLYSWLSLITELNFTTNGNYYSIYYPFTDIPFLNGENNWKYKIFNLLIPNGFYALFFVLLSNIFDALRQPKLLSVYCAKQLKWFYLVNIFLPSSTILFALIILGDLKEGFKWAATVHFFLGVFVYFLFVFLNKENLILNYSYDNSSTDIKKQ